MISTKMGKKPAFWKMYIMQKKWENRKENKGNNKVQTRSQDNTLTLGPVKNAYEITETIFFGASRVPIPLLFLN